MKKLISSLLLLILIVPFTYAQEEFKNYSKFDFVPGDQAIYYEDFPAKWNTNASGEIVTINNAAGKWLKTVSDARYKPEITTSSFLDNFTIELDVVFKAGNEEEIDNSTQESLVDMFPSSNPQALDMEGNESGARFHISSQVIRAVNWKNGEYGLDNAQGKRLVTNKNGKVVRLLSGFRSIVSSAKLCAQEDTAEVKELKKIILVDGSEVIGTLESEDSISIFFRTISNIQMTIPKNQVKSIVALHGEVVQGEYRRDDPNSTRLFFAPTARSLKMGQGYFSAYEIFFPFLAVGVTDFATLGGGISLFPFASAQLLYLAPKVRVVHFQNFDLAGGVLYINTTSGSSSGVGILYGLTTFGSMNTSLTAGLGWGFIAGGEIANEPIFMIGGELRISNSAKFISENWIPPSSEILFLSFGIRFFGENIAGDFGLIHPVFEKKTKGFPFIPWIGFAYNFGVSK